MQLLRDVIERLEAIEAAWPFRKQVVACAGVCRTRETGDDALLVFFGSIFSFHDHTSLMISVHYN